MKFLRSSGALFLLGIGSTLVYLAALLRFPLLTIYNIPLQNLDKLTGSNPTTGIVITSAVVLLFIGYGLGAIALTHNDLKRAHWLVFLFPVLFGLLLLFVYPTTSLDIYDYLFRGRMAVRYGANNFVSVPADFAADPLLNSQPFRFIPWNRAVTAYGPFWEILSYAAAWLGGERRAGVPPTLDPYLLHLILAYKALAAFGFLICGAVIWGAVGITEPRQRWLGLYLWLWNPLALWESIAAGHNDAWMVTMVVAALWAFGAIKNSELRIQNSKSTRTSRETRKNIFTLSPVQLVTLSLIALTFGGLIKYLALIFGPLLLAASLRGLPTWRARAWLVLVVGLVCGSIIVVAYAPYWQGAATLRNFGDRGTLFYATWLSALQAGLVETKLLTRNLAQQFVSVLATLLLAVGVVWSAWRGWRAPEHTIKHAALLLLWFLLVCNPWFQSWYLLWALALVAIQPLYRRMLLAVVTLSLTAMLSYVAGSFLLPALGWKSDSAAWNILLALLIYFPPLVIFFGGDRPRIFAAKSAKAEYV